jgi:hypothetical protein
MRQQQLQRQRPGRAALQVQGPLADPQQLLLQVEVPVQQQLKTRTMKQQNY